MEIEIIDTGYFFADGGAMFGAIPKTSWGKRYASNEANGCILAMRSLLIKTDCGRIILVDTGAGNKHLRQLSYYKFFDLKDLHEELLKRDVLPEQVTDVVLTHLHFDHCGYVTLKKEDSDLLELAFPEATHWVSKEQWESFTHPHPLEKSSFIRENMELAAEKEHLRFVSKYEKLCTGVSLKLFNGHTAGQIVPYFKMGGKTYVLPGDVIPLAPSVSPHWISAYDTSPLQSFDEKMRLLDEAAKEEQAIFFCHDAYTLCATVKKIGAFFKVNEVTNSRKYTNNAG